MFLTRIEITGFKSFAKKTVLDFSDGGVFKQGQKPIITAIVGPNGSGKSNIADALRWSMGEQSMKNLRSKKSQDIIFAGSGKKAQLGSAQVSLYLDNTDKKIPLEYPEVVITRRIYRDGEMEYLINGTKVRLTDVIDILAQAGIGQRSYAIINQGMADQVLNANLLERRSIIEEAAGVKEYQIKKERSQRKLKNTQANLERVGQLLIELEPHLRVLKKQSQKAQKGEEFRRELKQKQLELFGFLWRSFSNSCEHAKQAQNILAQEMINIQRELEDLKERLNKESHNSTNAKQEIFELEQKERTANQALYDFERQLVVEEGKLELEKERTKNIQTFEVIPVGVEFIKKNLVGITEQQERLVKKIVEVKKIEDISELKEYAVKIAEQMKTLYAGVMMGKMEKQKPSEEIERQKAINEKRLVELQAFIEKLKRQRDKLVLETLDLKREIEVLVKKDQTDRKIAIELEDKIRRGQFELEKIRERLNDAKIEVVRIEVKEEDLVDRIKREINLEPKNLDYQGDPINTDEYEREIYKLKINLEQIGGIDEMVLQEYEEMQKRYDFLLQESQDLREAMLKLKEVVKEMDKLTKDRFEKTFEHINKEFAHYFSIIFGGGKAELKKVALKVLGADNLQETLDLTEEEFVEEKSEDVQQGIEITACPPGKKINSLGMLSGGERALTSLALLFAIIAHNPPPFAFLDEVEAALDEANSKRFSRILTELSDKTQFVLITHNRQTMREASVLYGVTMQDDGTSKLLSVKLDQVGDRGEIKE